MTIGATCLALLAAACESGRDELALLDTTQQAAPLPALTASKASSDALLAAINTARARGGDCGVRGLMRDSAPLAPSAALAQAAEAHAFDMLTRGYFGHEAPDGTRAASRAHRFGFEGDTAEILARGALAPDAVVARWLASPDHCAALLSRRHTQVGISVVHGQSSVWVAELGIP